jgi:hypothetical protein
VVSTVGQGSRLAVTLPARGQVRGGDPAPDRGEPA